MRQRKLLLLYGLLYSVTAFSQNNTLDKVMVALNSAEVFKNCAVFKKDINQRMMQVKSIQGLDSERFNNLRIAYTDVYEKYDAFLKTVMMDLSQINHLKNLLANPEAAAQNYAAAYNAVKEAYESNFLPQYNNLTSEGAKGIPIAVLLKLGMDAFKFISNSIKNRRIDKEETLNLVLPVINERLFNKLQLPTWSQLDIPEPSGYKKEEAVVIPAQSTGSLNGQIVFYVSAADGSGDHPFSFAMNEGRKDLQVISENGGQKLATDEHFTSLESYPVGTRFRMEVNNTGFTYALALNSTGISLIFPVMNLSIIQTASTKDLTITGNETPPIGKVQVPGLNHDGSPLYFGITKNALREETRYEELAVILSKSELVLEEIIEKLNSVTGNLSERITAVFGEQKIDRSSANLSIQENGISFNADQSHLSVLPLVFKIAKQ